LKLQALWETHRAFFQLTPDWRPAEFSTNLHAAAQVADSKEGIVTLGVKPSYAATGYGYIEREQTGSFGGLPSTASTALPKSPTAKQLRRF